MRATEYHKITITNADCEQRYCEFVVLSFFLSYWHQPTWFLHDDTFLNELVISVPRSSVETEAESEICENDCSTTRGLSDLSRPLAAPAIIICWCMFQLTQSVRDLFPTLALNDQSSIHSIISRLEREKSFIFTHEVEAFQIRHKLWIKPRRLDLHRRLDLARHTEEKSSPLS